eukprot:1965462-Heterocapsa_arctica.AAC.1
MTASLRRAHPRSPVPQPPPPTRRGAALTKPAPAPLTPALAPASPRRGSPRWTPLRPAMRSSWANGWTKASAGFNVRRRPEADPGHPAHSPRASG